jgi:biotin carboxylase
MTGADRTAKPRLAVVFGDGVAVHELMRGGADVAELVLIFDAADATLAGLHDMLQDEVECVEYRSDDRAALLHRHRQAPFTALTTFAEDKIRLTAEIAALLGLAYHTPQCAEALTDKSVQRSVLAKAGLGVEYGVARNADEAADLVRRLGVPCVVKPLAGAGSRHTYAVDPADAAATLSRVPEAYPAVVEERLETTAHPRSDLLADVVSVETVFFDGQPRHLGVSDRFSFAQPFRETGMVFPSQLPTDVLDEVYDTATRALSVLGVTTGATHTELKLTPDGPRIIEVNGRLGGFVARLTELATGTNALEPIIRAVCGQPVTVASPTAVAAAAMLVPPVEATRLESRVPAGALRAVDSVVSVDVRIRPDTAVDYRDGWWAHVACVWYRADDWYRLSAAHTQVLALAKSELVWG